MRIHRHVMANNEASEGGSGQEYIGARPCPGRISERIDEGDSRDTANELRKDG